MKNYFLALFILLLSGCQTAPQYTGPVTPVASRSMPGMSHRVKAGETLWKLSRIYNVDIDEILRLNNFSENSTIEVGQIVLIPARQIRINEPVRSAGDDFIWPLKGRIITSFGSDYRSIINRGINIQAQEGQDFMAARAGRVVFYADSFGNFGRTVIIEHGDGLRSVYSRAGEFFVKPGDNVQRGQIIGKVGVSLKDRNAYLHFEIRKGAIAQNPLFYLS